MMEWRGRARTWAPTFSELQRRLLERIRFEVRNGRYTERGLAGATALSQPHLHNVLAGYRGMSIETADALLAELRMSCYDLLSVREVLMLEELRGGPLSVERCSACARTRGRR